MHQFTPRPDSFKEIRKKIIVMMLIILSGIVFIVLVVPVILSDKNSSDDPTTWPYVLVLLTGVMGFSVFNALKRQKANFESYVLKITDEALVREAINVPTITLPKTEVREIIKNANGSFTIVGERRINAIGVPPQIDNPEKLEQLLNEIKTVNVKASRSWLERLLIPISLSGAALMMTTFLASNKIIVFASGLTVVVILVYSMIVIHQSKNIDQRIKRMNFIMIVPLLAVIAAIILKLMS